jgi:hypothetical protein
MSTPEEDDEAGRLRLVAYKVMAESAEKSSDRRQQANNFFVAANLAIGGGYAFMIDKGYPQLMFAGMLVGVITCGLWALTLWYYRSLNSAKYRLLGEFEVEKGIVGYQREWEVFSAATPFGRLGVSLSSIELFVAFIAFAAHILAPFLLQPVICPAHLTLDAGVCVLQHPVPKP